LNRSQIGRKGDVAIKELVAFVSETRTFNYAFSNVMVFVNKKNSQLRGTMKFILPTVCLILMNAISATAGSPVTYHTVHVDGVDIFYREAGPTNGPVLLLLHGVPSSSRMYQPMLESVLSEKYHLIAPDFPGFGHSSWPDPKEFSYTFDHLARVTEALTDALNLKRYTLFLHDYGGPVGMRMARGSPGKSGSNYYSKRRFSRGRLVSTLGSAAQILE
jgi:hypothetical protein